MPIDPSIPLGYRPPPIAPLEIQSPLDRYAKMISLKNLMTEQAAGELGLQAKQFALGQTQEQAQRDAKMRDLFLTDPNPTTAKMLAIDPVKGAALAKTFAEQQAETIKANHEKAKRFREIAGSIKDAPSYQSAITTGLGEKLITPEQGQALSALDWNDPKTQDYVRHFQEEAATREKEHEQVLKDAEEARKVAKAPAELTETQAKAAEAVVKAEVAKRQNNAINLEFAMAKGPEAFQAELAKLPEAERAPFLGATSPQDVRNRGLTAHEQVLAEQAAANAMATAEYRNARLAQGAGRASDDDALVQTVIDNPSYWYNLTPTAQTKIGPKLAAKGYTDFGKPLGETAITKMSETRSAVESLKDLRQTLKDNEKYIGPLAGLQALNPYSEGRKAQATIDLVKQRVGKALEGGVLRKEDEEKYKRILATLNDTPSTAISKTDNLITTLERDMRLFEDQQRRGGRNVPAGQPVESQPVEKPATKRYNPATGKIEVIPNAQNR